MSEETKRCTACGEVKPLAEFSKSRRNKTGVQSWCKECYRSRNKAYRDGMDWRAYQNDWYWRNREKMLPYLRERNYWNKYGLTRAGREALLSDQGGKCPGCLDEIAFGGQYGAHVDHDQETGGIRGILCRDCNVGGGILKHDPERLRRLADYFEAFHAKE